MPPLVLDLSQFRSDEAEAAVLRGSDLFYWGPGGPGAVGCRDSGLVQRDRDLRTPQIERGLGCDRPGAPCCEQGFCLKPGENDGCHDTQTPLSGRSPPISDQWVWMMRHCPSWR